MEKSFQESNLSGLGMGTWRIGEDASKKKDELAALRYGLDNGIKVIDTAEMYGEGKSEKLVGEAIRGYDRSKIFLISKFYPYHASPELERQSLEKSLKRLGTDYLDLYLMHWPGLDEALMIDTWQGMEDLYKNDKVKNIGVSNFNTEHLEALLAQVSIKPVINQIEFHPYLTQSQLRRYLEVQNIQAESWSPLMNAQILEDATVKAVASEIGKTPAQVIIRWNVEHGVVVIPKSVTPSRIEENLNVFDFVLTKGQIERLDQLNEDKRIGPDPLEFSGN